MCCKAVAFGGMMGHDWVFDVLRDLRAYALANGFAGLAAKVDEALLIAGEEIVPGVLSKTSDTGTPH